MEEQKKPRARETQNMQPASDPPALPKSGALPATARQGLKESPRWLLPQKNPPHIKKRKKKPLLPLFYLLEKGGIGGIYVVRT